MSDEFVVGHFILSLVLGYGVAYFFTRLGDTWQKFGAFLGSFIIMVSFIVLAYSATAVVGISSDLSAAAAYTLGFVAGFVKR